MQRHNSLQISGKHFKRYEREGDLFLSQKIIVDETQFRNFKPGRVLCGNTCHFRQQKIEDTHVCRKVDDDII